MNTFSDWIGHSRRNVSFVLAVLAFAQFPGSAWAVIRYVNAARPDDSGNGLSWPTAEKTLQAALLSAAPGDEVWIAAGTYSPDQGGGQIPGNRDATFTLLNGVSVYGGFAGTETMLSERNVLTNVTTLSGDLSGNDGPGLFENYTENSYHVVDGSGTDSTAVLDGFTIRAGNADGIGAQQSGGGLRVSSGSPTVRNCVFMENVAKFAGGGVVNEGGSPIFRTCSFVLNAAQGLAGSSGGAVSCRASGTTTILNGLFYGNSATSNGGAIQTTGDSTTNVIRSYLYANSALNGGAIASSVGDTNLYDCDFWTNSATGDGGTIQHASGGTTTLRNCTLGENSATDLGGGINQNGGTVDVKNSILWGNSDGSGSGSSAQFRVNAGTATLDYSIIQGGWSGGGGIGVLSSDPKFFDPASNNHVLLQNSPAVDAGDNTAVPPDAFDLDEDDDTSERLPLDTYGRPRFTNNLNVTESGVAAPGYPDIVDMGAYEVATIIYWYVDADAPGKTHNGSSWETAFTKLQDALSATGTAMNEEIWVANGTYYPDAGNGITPGDRTATFQMRDHVSIYGGFGGFENSLSERNIEANPTILSGDLNGNDTTVPCTQNSPDCDSFGGLCVEGSCIIKSNNAENSYHVVTGSGTDSTAILDGITVTAGNADGGFPDESGGGMYNFGGSPMVTNCAFSGNASIGSGGGMFNNGNASPTVTNCTFSRNSANTGAGMYNDTASEPTVRSCTIRQNAAGTFGGGMVNEAADATVIACTFSGNSAAMGGGMFIISSVPQVINCAFLGNTAATTGGGMVNDSSNVSMINCTFSGNSAGVSGGGMTDGPSSNATLTNNTFSGNTAGGTGGGIYNDASNSTVNNCLLWGNSDAGGMDESAQMHVASGSPIVNYSIVQGGWSGGGSNNVNADPLFVDADGPDNVVGTEDDNLRLLPGSAAIDSASSNLIPSDVTDLDGDADLVESIPQDLDGNPRYIDDPFVVDTGVPGMLVPVVDMGAYEFQANVLYVDASATGNDDGSSWEHAYTKLQDALAAAGILGSGITEIWVADGVYKPDQGGKETPGDRNASFQLFNGIAIYGGFGGFENSLSERNIEANPTILSGDLAGNDTPIACSQNVPDCDAHGELCDGGFCIIHSNNGENSYQVVKGGATNATAILDGFTITAGKANGVSPQHSGGGMYTFNGNPTVSNCQFIGNWADSAGGGMHNRNGSPKVSSCSFIHNYASSAAGMLNWTTSALISNCTLRKNNAQSGGGGMVNQSGSPIITNCVFLGNDGGNGGGGMIVQVNSNAMITNCVFSGNWAVDGGGIEVNNSNPSITNCSFSGNSAGNSGGGVNTSLGNPPVTNCIFWNNSDLGGMDESAQIHVGSGIPLVGYSIVQGGWSGAGSNNLNADPLFVDPDGPDNVVGTSDDDLRLSAGSPAIDAANTPALPLDTADADGDGNTTEHYPFDLAGKPRTLDDPNTEDTGVPGSPIADMGAYEYFGDCNGNGIPDQCDLSCGAPTGPCDIPGCGGSSDCGWAEGFPNGIPDECDIGCGIPDCDDCNLNGVPDACDIANATSLDEDANFIPDECSQFDPGCVSDTDWSCFDNWNIPGEVYPDNTGPVTYSVTLDDSDDVFLDVDVTIDTLRIINDSVLSVTQTDSAGDLNVVESGGVLLESKLFAGVGRIIDVTSGPLLVRGRGTYSAPPGLLFGLEGSDGIVNDKSRLMNYELGEPTMANHRWIMADRQSALDHPPLALGGPVCGNFLCEEGETACTCSTDFCGACLAPEDLFFSDCEPCVPGMCSEDECGVFLSGTMALTVNNLRMDGTGACPCNATKPPCGPGGLRGVILPPPKFRALDASDTDVNGNMDLSGPVVIQYSSSQNLTLNGNFNNGATSAGCFNWSTGGMTLNGSAARNFEVAGRDLGSTLDGFYYGPDTNFSMGELEIGPGRSVTLVNQVFNTVGTGACQEALYVHTLILRGGSTLTLNNCRVYYESLVQEGGAAMISQGCGEDQEIAPCVDTASCSDGNACTIDGCNAGTCANVPIPFLAYGDASYTGIDSVVDVDDILCVLDGFAGLFVNCPLERVDLAPCVVPTCAVDEDCADFGVPCSDGRCRVMDVDDILAVLAAFIGEPGCPDPCP